MDFKVGKMYEWKTTNFSNFTLYAGLQSDIYKRNDTEIKAGSAVFALEVIERKEYCDVRFLTDTGVIAWSRIFYRHAESTWDIL